MLFKRRYLRKILDGTKTQTRRPSSGFSGRAYKVGDVVPLRDSFRGPARAQILITRRFQQRLGDISLDEVRKEGFTSLEEFKREWMSIYGEWNPDQTVTVYEFRLVKEKL